MNWNTVLIASFLFLSRPCDAQQINTIRTLPGGTTTQLQFNNGFAFGGIPGSVVAGGTVTLTALRVTSEAVTGNYFSVGGTTFAVTGGFVGIGTSAPGQRLDIRVRTGEGVMLTNLDSSNKRWAWVASGNSLFISEPGVANQVAFQAGGNVGIGDTNPGQKLYISSGTIHIGGSGSPATGGALCLNGAGNMVKCTSAVDASGNCTCP